MEVELLDCPFCGGQAVQALYNHNKISNGISVRCINCGGSTERIIYQHNDVGLIEMIKRMKDSQAEAAKLWNKRFEI
jgi:Lar family restriction alleviation protein